jgi:hypothetical protein
MSDIPRPRTHDIDFSTEHDDITEDVGPDLESGDDLDTGAIIGGADAGRESPADEKPDDGAGSEAS